MAIARTSESTQQYLDKVADDVRALLGGGIELIDVRLDRVARPRSLSLTATYRLGAVQAESVGRGASAIEAHAKLRSAIVEDRVAIGLRALTRSA